MNEQPGSDRNPSLMSGLLASPVTLTLIGLSVIVFLVSNLGSNLEVLSWLTVADLHGFDRTIAGGFEAIRHGQVWRIITPIFIHFGFLHILFNMMWLSDLGGVIERRWSSRTLLALVVVLAVTANLGQYCVNWDLRLGVQFANALSGGMSGVVYGLLGYVWVRSRHDPTAGVRLHQQTVIMMIAWLAFCCTGFVGPIANSAHVIGLLVGGLWGRLAALRMAGRHDQDEG